MNEITSNDKNIAVLAHLSAFVGLIFPLFGNIIAPFVIYITNKENNKFVADNAREAVNFNISITIYMGISLVLMIVLVGFFMFFVLGLVWFVTTIIAMLRASEGQVYRYPLTIDFIK